MKFIGQVCVYYVILIVPKSVKWPELLYKHCNNLWNLVFNQRLEKLSEMGLSGSSVPGKWR